MKPEDFVHLHLHTEYSLLDGACRIDRLFDRIKELGQKAVAITDHGVMFGCIDFFKAAQKTGIKPIIGCEVYVAPRSRKDKVFKLDSSPYHLILLVKNDVGYRNLIKMVSIANEEGFYTKPRIDRELLEEYHEGLICLSACLSGELPRRLSEGDYEAAEAVASYYKNLFGDGNYYIELQDHGIEDQKRILPDLIRLARKLDIPLAATNDCHYINRDDSEMQKVLTCISTGHTLQEDDPMGFECDEFYVKSTEEMTELFSYVPEAVSNTSIIAQQCNFEFVFGQTKLPFFEAPDGKDNMDFFNELCEKGLNKLYGPDVPDAARQRLEYEKNVISSMGYTNYYLIVWDFINYAKSHDIPVGPGRGSGAGSIAAYCMGITALDPLKYDLLFERFLNPERVSMPDFDVDFCYERRQDVIDYVIRKYGKDHVAQIVTFGTMKAKQAVRDVGRVLNLPYGQVDSVAKLIPTGLDVTIDKAMETQELKDLCNRDFTIKRLIDLARKIEGMPRHASTHAAGVVITDRPVSDYVPLARNDENMVCQFDMVTIEELGLLKMDFLGLRTLTVIADCEKLVKLTNPDFSMDKISMEDAEVYEMLSSGETEGVFQLESSGMKQLLKDMKPVNLEDIIAVISLYRPGPMDSIGDYLANRRNPDKTKYTTPELKPILDVTCGVTIYQEQVMQICRSLAGFSLGKADIIRRAMAKKKKEAMAKGRGEFVEGCVANGITDTAANKIYDDMTSFASYAFNKSHAAVYALVAYETAFLKCHYPVEFMASLMTSVLDDTAKLVGYMNECTRLGIKILPPDINESIGRFSVKEGNIRYGLWAIKNVGRAVVDEICRERDTDGPFATFHEFLIRCDFGELNRRALENMVYSGVFDCFRKTRRGYIAGLDYILKGIQTERKNNMAGQMDFFSLMEDPTGNTKVYSDDIVPDIEEFEPKELLTGERNACGIYLSGHPLQEYVETASSIGAVSVGKVCEYASAMDGKSVLMLCEITAVKTRINKAGEKWAVATIEDLSGTMELLVFAKTYSSYSAVVVPEKICLIKGRVSAKEDEKPSIMCQDIKEITSPADVKVNNNYSENRVQTAELKPRVLYLRFSERGIPEVEKCSALLRIFSGNIPVHFYYAATSENLLVPYDMFCDGSDELRNKLCEILGADSVVFK